MPLADDPVDTFDQYVGWIFFGTLSLVLIVAGTSLLLGHKSLARGFVLGGIASLTNLVIMASDVRRRGKAVNGQLVRPSYGRYSLRMIITAAALVYAAVSAKISLWAVIPALFTAQFIMTCLELLGSLGREKI